MCANVCFTERPHLDATNLNEWDFFAAAAGSHMQDVVFHCAPEVHAQACTKPVNHCAALKAPGSPNGPNRTEPGQKVKPLHSHLHNPACTSASCYL